MKELNQYITFRYKNWLDYARHMARVHHFEGWEDDLLNDVIIDLLGKNENLLLGLLARKTKKIVNGQPTTELDKFVLKMLHLNAFSPVAPFRKNTLGNKIIDRKNNKITTRQNTQLNGDDVHDEAYNMELNNKLDVMHSRNIKRLADNGFNAEAVKLYQTHFIRGRPFEDYNDAAKDSITRIRQFLVVTKKTLLDDFTQEN